MARPKGFEPLTPRFVVWCSIQLSYGRVCRELAGRWSLEPPAFRNGEALRRPS